MQLAKTYLHITKPSFDMAAMLAINSQLAWDLNIASTVGGVLPNGGHEIILTPSSEQPDRKFSREEIAKILKHDDFTLSDQSMQQ